MKRRLAAAGVCGLLILAAAVASPSAGERGYFAATFAPVFLALILPFGLPEERDLRRDAVLPPAAALASFLALAPFMARDPGLGRALGAAAFLGCWAVLVSGLFRAGSRFGPAAGHLLAGGAGLFLCATHLLFDPVVSAAESPALRRALISFATNANPSLEISASFFGRDMLLRSYVYARSDIGAYQAHPYGAWGWTVMVYVAVGAMGWLAGKRGERPEEEEA